MQITSNIRNKWFDVAAFSVLFATIVVFALTGSYFVLAAPFVFLWAVLLGVNWKTAYWIFLFSIPASIQINFAGDTMSITLPDQPLMWSFLLVFILMWASNPGVIPKWWWRDPLVLIVTLQFLWTIVAVLCSKMIFFSLKFLLAKTWLLVCFFILPIWIFREKKDFIKGFMLLLIPHADNSIGDIGSSRSTWLPL